MNQNSNSQPKNTNNNVLDVNVSDNLLIPLKPPQISVNLVHLLLKQ
ncbi:MAG: hypothetical protein WBF90_13105 [Rivularia sp. (in: cyanobacteria)]